MIYCRHLSRTETLVAAADQPVEFEDFISKIGLIEGLSYRYPDMMEMMTDERFAGLSRPPILIEFADEQAQSAFVAEHGLTTVKGNALRDKSTKMMEILRASEPDPNDDRTLEEIFSLKDNDPWDRRTDEEKAAAEEYKKKAADAKKNGNMTGESFGGLAKAGSSVVVTDGRITVDEDGNVIDAKVIARKIKTDPHSIPDDDRLEIEHTGPIGIYFKVEVIGAKLADVAPALEPHGIDIAKVAVSLRNNSAGCWMAIPRKLLAEEIGEHLSGIGMTVDVYAIGRDGVRVTPKGVNVVDEGQEKPEGARPWNDGAAEWEALDEEGRKKLLKKTLRGDQFLFCGWYDGPEKGTTIVIVPKSHFIAKKELWHQSLPLKLPADVKEMKPGVYKSEMRDFNQISADMTQNGFIFSIMLQVWVNSQ